MCSNENNDLFGHSVPIWFVCSKNGPHFLNTINQFDFKKSFIMTDTNIVDIYINYLMAQ